MAAKIVKIQIAKKPGKWGGYKVRLVSERGAIVSSFDAFDLRAARSIAAGEARHHGAQVEAL